MWCFILFIIFIFHRLPNFNVPVLCSFNFDDSNYWDNWDKMTIFHDEVEIEDFEWDPEEEMYYYPCPCGDRFQISKEELIAGEEVATCPSCSLVIKVVYDKEKFQAEAEEILSDDAEKEAVKA